MPLCCRGIVVFHAAIDYFSGALLCPSIIMPIPFSQLGAVIVGDVKPTWGGQWGSLCMFQGGCAHLGIPGE